MDEIKVLANAILELNRKGQLCPQTIEALERIGDGKA